MFRNTTNFFVLISLLIIVTSCGLTKKTDRKDKQKLPKIAESTLISRLDSLSKQKPDFFYSRINTTYKDDKEETSFKTSLRMRIDSAFQATITFAKIPLINILVTPDSLTLVNKRSQCYLHDEVSVFKDLFNLNFDFKNFEELFLGIPIAWNSKEPHFQVDDSYNYIVSRNIKEDNLNIQYYLTNDGQTLQQVKIKNTFDSTYIVLSYGLREMISGFSIPQEIKVNIQTPENNIIVDLNYIKPTINETRVLYLTIPDKYAVCE